MAEIGLVVNYRDTATIVHPAQSTDADGTVTYDYTNGTQVVVAASVQPQLSEETVDVQLSADRWRLYVAAGTVLAVTDRVQWNGLTLAVDGRVEDWSTSRVPHLECALREVPEDILARERLQAATLLTDHCVIDRKTGQVLDSTTGKYVDAYETIFDGPCRLEPVTSTRITAEPGRGLDERRYSVRLPWTAVTPVQVEDRFKVTVSDDAWAIGRHMRIIAVGYGAAPYRDLLVEDLP